VEDMLRHDFRNRLRVVPGSSRRSGETCSRSKVAERLRIDLSELVKLRLLGGERLA